MSRRRPRVCGYHGGMVYCLVPLLVLAVAPAPNDAASPSLGATMTPGMARTAPPEPDGPPATAVGGNYVHLSTGIGFTPVADASAVAFAWGLAGGRYFVAGKRFAGAAGGFGEHVPVWFGGVGPPLHDVRLGAELRLGGRTRHLFAYGIGRLGVALNFNYDIYDYIGDSTETKLVRHKVYPWVFGSVGAGIQAPLGKRFLIGGEQLFDIGTEAFFLVRLRLLLGIRF